MLNFLRLVFGWKAGKRDKPSNWGSQFATPGGQCSSIIEINILAFISNLGPNNKPKMLRGGLSNFFQP
jgi:hypothetical protein